MKLIMTGLDHKCADITIREKFAFTKERTARILTAIKSSGIVEGCVIISTCNRTELYVSTPYSCKFNPYKTLCDTLDIDFIKFKQYFVDRSNKEALSHLCRVASGLDSQILGDDQIITQVREALELSRNQNCTDSYIETIFRTAIQAAKMIKTEVILKYSGIDSIPNKTLEKLRTLYPLTNKNAVVIGNGQMGRLVTELLIRENVNVTVTLREYKKNIVQIPNHANMVGYSKRYKAIEKADIVVSATTSPHFTLNYDELSKLERLPEIIVDLAVPRDVEPSIQESGIILLTIDDISEESRVLPSESISKINQIIEKHIEKYNRWLLFKENIMSCVAGGSQQLAITYKKL